MSKWKPITLLILVLVFGTWAWVSDQIPRKPGAYLTGPGTVQLLPLDRVWRFDFVLPRKLAKDESVNFEIRRWSENYDENKASQSPVLSRDKPDAVLRTGGYAQESTSGQVALQLMDLRDFSEDIFRDHSLRISGGMWLSGMILSLDRRDNFCLGHLHTWSVHGGSRWKDDELPLVTFASTDKISYCTYQAVLVIKKRP